MSESKKLIPKRRFKTFEDREAWSLLKQLNEYAEILTGGTPSTQIKDFWMPKEVPWMSSGEINKKRIFSTDNMISQKGFDSSSARWIKEKSILIALAGQGKTRGKVAINELQITTNQSIAAVVPNEKLDSEFLFQNLGMRYEELRSISSGDGSRGGLNKKIISELHATIPNIDEQKIIGIFFQKLDNLINTQQKKLEKAKTLKSAYLTEMFPNEGELKPRYRFLGFKKDWSITQFKNLANIRRGLTYTPSNLVLDGVRILRSSNIDSDRFILRNDDIFIDQSYVSISLVKENDILITSANGSSRLVGKHALIKITNNEKAVHGGFMLLATSNQPFFTNAIMSSNWYRKFLNTYVAGGNGAIGNLNKTELANQDISIPTTLEQTQIGNFFKLLDDKIALEQKKLDKLKHIKQAYLNEMFV
jgi:type I restriction enzyme, S subunit